MAEAAASGRRLPDLRQRRHAATLHRSAATRRATRSILVVVEDVGDLWALERAGATRGRYHVLGGVLSPLDGIGPDDLNIASLDGRVRAGGVGRSDPRDERHRRGPDDGALHHRPAGRLRRRA